MALKSFRDLILLRSFPTSEKYLLVDQMNRASRGIPSLIAENWAKRRSLKEFRRYLRNAIGEANERTKELIERYDKLAAKTSKLKDN